MIYEYALDPQVLKSLSSIPFYRKKFGFVHGRVLGQLPSSHEFLTEIRKYYDYQNLDYTQKSHLYQFISDIGKSFSDIPHRTFDSTQTWLDNARREDCIHKFQGIIVDSPSSSSEISPHKSLSTDPEWEIDLNERITLSSSQWEKYASLLILTSNSFQQIKIIDPYFDLEKKSNMDIIDAIYLAVSKSPRRLSIEIYTTPKAVGYPGAAKISPARFNKENWNGRLTRWKNKLRTCRLANAKVSIYVIDDKMEDFHDRYILNNLFGFSIGIGIESTGKTTLSTLLSETSFNDIYLKYSPNTTHFQHYASFSESM